MLLSALDGLCTINAALKGNGQLAGAAPSNDAGLPKGSHGQLSCGENATRTVQDCPASREKADPNEGAQVSASVKFASPLKSLGAPLSKAPLLTCQESDRPLNVAPDGSLLVMSKLCAAAPAPSNCEGKVIDAGVRVTGCVQAVGGGGGGGLVTTVVTTGGGEKARHKLPESPAFAMLAPEQDFVFTA